MNNIEVCKTCNISDESATLEEFESMARRAEASGAAGLVIVDNEDVPWKHEAQLIPLSTSLSFVCDLIATTQTGPKGSLGF